MFTATRKPAARAAAGLTAAALALVGAVGAAAPVAAAPALPTSIVSLGDSITRGFNACGFYVDCTRRSWSTGDDEDVSSHRVRLRGIGAQLGGQANLARSGARVDALAAQAAAAVERSPQYVTIEVGANDACRGSEAAMTPVARYRDHLDAGLAVLRAGAPGARVFLASIPDLKRLWETGHDKRLARWAWAKFDVCPSMLDDAGSDDPEDAARRDRVRDRVIAYNAQLAEACAAYGPNCVFDDNAVFRTRFSLDQVSKWDYFHPNTSGQRLLADVTWSAGFFG